MKRAVVVGWCAIATLACGGDDLRFPDLSCPFVTCVAGAGGGAGTGGGAGAGGAGSGGGVPLPPTFTSIWDTIIPGCQGPTCHSGMAGGNLRFDIAAKDAGHAQLLLGAMGMNLPTATNPTHCMDTGMMRVVPGNPDMSLLYAKVRTDMEAPCGSRMPTGGMLPPDQIELIRAWIAAGAMND